MIRVTRVTKVTTMTTVADMNRRTLVRCLECLGYYFWHARVNRISNIYSFCLQRAGLGSSKLRDKQDVFSTVQ